MGRCSRTCWVPDIYLSHHNTIFRRQVQQAAVHDTAHQNSHLHALPHPPERLRLLRHLRVQGPRQQHVRVRRQGIRLHQMLLLCHKDGNINWYVLSLFWIE